MFHVNIFYLNICCPECSSLPLTMDDICLIGHKVLGTYGSTIITMTLISLGLLQHCLQHIFHWFYSKGSKAANYGGIESYFKSQSLSFLKLQVLPTSFYIQCSCVVISELPLIPTESNISFGFVQRFFLGLKGAVARHNSKFITTWFGYSTLEAWVTQVYAIQVAG